MNLEAKRSLISIRLQMLMAVFNKRAGEETVDALKRVFCEGLEHLPQSAITKGFSRAEQTLERFPTPKIMREICGEFLPSQGWKYDFKPGKDHDGVPCLIDPDPNCSDCREPRSKHPHPACKEFSGEQNKFMYLPQDCPEGREYLAALRKICGRKP